MCVTRWKCSLAVANWMVWMNSCSISITVLSEPENAAWVCMYVRVGGWLGESWNSSSAEFCISERWHAYLKRGENELIISVACWSSRNRNSVLMKVHSCTEWWLGSWEGCCKPSKVQVNPPTKSNLLSVCHGFVWRSSPVVGCPPLFPQFYNIISVHLVLECSLPFAILECLAYLAQFKLWSTIKADWQH